MKIEKIIFSLSSLYKEKYKKETQIVSCITISIIIILLIFFSFPQVFLIKANLMPIKIIAIGEPGENNPEGATEVWISEIKINSKIIDLENIQLTEGWEYRKDYRDGVIFSINNQPATLKLYLPPGIINIVFIKHDWTGKVRIENPKTFEDIDLYRHPESNSPGWQIVEIENKNYLNYDIYTSVDKILLIIGLLFITIIFTIILYYGYLIQKKYVFVYFIFVIAFILVLILNSNISVTRIIIILPPIIYMLFDLRKNNFELMLKYRNKICKSVLSVINLYFTFALVGNELFLVDPQIIFNIEKCLTFVLLYIILYPYGETIIYCFEKLRSFTNNWKKNNNKRKILLIGIISSFICVVILLIISIGFYPATMSHDGANSHWPRAMGLRNIGNDVPAAYSIIVKLTAQVAPTPYTYVLLQIFLFSWAVGAISAFCYEKGMPLLMVFTIPLILSILPNNYMSLVMLCSNSLFSIINLWVLFILIKLIDDPKKFCRSITLYIPLSINTAIIGLIRHNSFLAVIAVGIIVSYITIKYIKEVKFILAASFIGSILLIQLVRGPIYNYYNVDKTFGPSTIINYGPLASPLAAAVKNNIDLPKNIIHIMNEILPYQEWGLRYNRYNSDIFSWSIPRPNFDQTNAKEFFGIYMKLLITHPDIVLLDRLDGMNILWNIFESRGEGAYNYRYDEGIASSLPTELLPPHLKDVEAVNYRYLKENYFTYLPLKIARMTSQHALFDFFIWRTGIYIVLLFYIILFCFKRKEQLYLLSIIPTIASLLTFVLVMGWQMYRYLWFFSLAMYIYLIFIVLIPKKGNNQLI